MLENCFIFKFSPKELSALERRKNLNCLLDISHISCRALFLLAAFLKTKFTGPTVAANAEAMQGKTLIF
jgi:hypothetical protein